jgi:hypothetical protein
VRIAYSESATFMPHRTVPELAYLPNRVQDRH